MLINGLIMKILKMFISIFLGEGAMFTIVDTPGFGDSQGQETEDELTEEMMNVLKNTSSYVKKTTTSKERKQYV